MLPVQCASCSPISAFAPAGTTRLARQLLPREDARSLVAAEIMRGIYYGVLQRIERADYDVFRDVIRVPRPRRAAIAAGIWARSLAGLRARS